MVDVRKWSREDWKVWLRAMRQTPTAFASACNISSTTFSSILRGDPVHENTWARVETVYQRLQGESKAAG